MKLTSVRARVTLWNVGVVALILACSAVTVHYTVSLSLIRGIDRDLERALAREKEMTQRYLDAPGPGFDRPDRRGPPPLDRPDRMDGGPDLGREGGPFGFQPDGFGRGPEPPPGGPRPEMGGRWRALREPYLQPGIFDLHGAPLNPVSTAKPWDTGALARSLKGETVTETSTIRGAAVRLISSPLRREGKTVAVLQMVRPLDELGQLMENLDRTLLVLLLPALAVAGLSGAFLTDRSLRPVRRFSDATTQLAATNLSLRLPVTGEDEFADLAKNFNHMTERLETAFEQQKRFTADASHELRTPLAAIRLYTSLALYGDSDLATCKKSLNEANAAARDMSRIVDDLMFLARSDNPGQRLDVKTVPVRDVVEAAVSELRAKERGASIQVHVPVRDLAVTGDPHQLRRLLTNLIENAVRHTPAEGSITVSATEEPSSVVLRVEDTGEGIPPEHLPRVFDRFHRVDEARSRKDGGAGLGLSICKSIAQAHSGSIEIESRPGEGTTVTVTLPQGDTAGTTTRRHPTPSPM